MASFSGNIDLLSLNGAKVLIGLDEQNAQRPYVCIPLDVNEIRVETSKNDASKQVAKMRVIIDPFNDAYKNKIRQRLYLPTIHNACSSLLAWVLVQLRLYLPTIQNACSSERNNLIHTLSCTYPLFRMHVHQLELFMVLVGSCTYPLFRMHVHPQINIILYNRHLLNVRALLFLLLNI